MLLNGKEVNNLIINGEKFSKNGGKLNVVNYQALVFNAKANGNIVLLSDTYHDLSAFLNKQVILFYSFRYDVNGSKGAITVTKPFRFTTDSITVSSVTGDGDVWVTYYSYNHELTVNCQSQWSHTPSMQVGLGILLEIKQ